MPRKFKSSLLMRRINKLVDAAKEDAYRGTRMPEEHERIDQNLQKAKLDLLDYVFEFVLEPGDKIQVQIGRKSNIRQ